MATCVSLRESLFVGTGVYVPGSWKDGVLVSASAFLKMPTGKVCGCECIDTWALIQVS